MIVVSLLAIFKTYTRAREHLADKKKLLHSLISNSKQIN